MSKPVCVIEFDGGRLTAMAAVVGKDVVEIKRWMSAARPETVLGDDPRAIGEWAAGELARAGIGRGAGIVALSRGDAVLKHLTLPKPPDATDAELSQMVKLQASRQIALPVDGTVVDYVPSGASSAESWNVLLAAMPSTRVEWARTLGTSAGLKVNRVALRCSGVAAVLRQTAEARQGTVVGVAIGWGSTEVVVVEEGRMVLARAVEAVRPTSRGEWDGFADRIAVEVQRTWMSYAAGKSGVKPELVAVPGDGDLTRAVAERSGEKLGCPSRRVALPAAVQVPAEMPDSERTACAPLAGLLVESMQGLATIDFLNPRKGGVDRAKRERAALVACLAGIVVVGAAWTVAKQRVDRVLSQAADTDADISTRQLEYDRLLADQARLAHLQEWNSTRVDWLGHINTLLGQVPLGGVARAESLRGELETKVVFRKTAEAYPAGEWASDMLAKFQLKGKANGRGLVTEMRGRLLQGDLYTVEMLGADVSDRFAFELSTTKLDPAARPKTEKDPAKTGAKQPGKAKTGGKIVEQAAEPKGDAK